MKYTIIADSCCNLFPRDLESEKINFNVVPLTLILGEEEFIDDESLDAKVFVEKMNNCKVCAKSACPAPEAFAEIMRKNDNIIAVLLSSKLSGTYASAMTAAEMVKNEQPDKKIFILDTLSAAAGLDHILYRLKELIERDEYSFDEIANKITEIRTTTRVKFLLQDIGNLVKNGRMNKLMGRVLSTVKIKFICGDDYHGGIKKYAMAIGTKRGLNVMAAMPAEALPDRHSPISVTHVHNEEDASFIRSVWEKKFGFKNVGIRVMRGLSSLYAADKGIVIAY
jgi:DegV family protein with EDD domain